jgi:hypothetical protein
MGGTAVNLIDRMRDIGCSVAKCLELVLVPGSIIYQLGREHERMERGTQPIRFTDKALSYFIAGCAESAKIYYILPDLFNQSIKYTSNFF